MTQAAAHLPGKDGAATDTLPGLPALPESESGSKPTSKVKPGDPDPADLPLPPVEAAVQHPATAVPPAVLAKVSQPPAPADSTPGFWARVVAEAKSLPPARPAVADNAARTCAPAIKENTPEVDLPPVSGTAPKSDTEPRLRPVATTGSGGTGGPAPGAAIPPLPRRASPSS